MKLLKPSTKIKIIVDTKISFYTTVKQIRADIGTSDFFNVAVQLALLSLEDMQDADKGCSPIGLAGNWMEFNIQLDIIK